MEKNKISVIVPVYNVEAYVERCVRSIMAQTYQNLEIILVDDGATDRSGAICDELAKEDNRIIVIHKTNGGLSDARNAGVAMATGAFIGFVDSDDYIVPEMYERMEAAITRQEADIAVCNYNYVNNDGELIADKAGIHPIGEEVISGKEAISKLVGPTYSYWVTAWNRLYRSEIAKAVSFPKGKIHEDEFTAHLFYDKAKKVVGVKEACYQYVVREDSIMTKKFSTKNLDYVDALNGRIRYCLDKQMNTEAAALTRWMQQHLILTYEKIDRHDDKMREKYKKCWNDYEETYQLAKKQCHFGVVVSMGAILFKISPKLANLVLKRIRA